MGEKLPDSQPKKVLMNSQVKIDLELFKDLAFPEDEVVVFPQTLGITGEAFRNIGLKFENEYGQTKKEHIDQPMQVSYNHKPSSNSSHRYSSPSKAPSTEG